jgi:hypothetical protein
MSLHPIFWNPRPSTMTGSRLPTPELKAAAARRIVLVDLYWTRDKDPRVPLGHGSLLAALRAAPDLDSRSLVLAVNCGHSTADIAARILEQVDGVTADRVDVAIGAYIWNEPIVQDLLPMLRAKGFDGRIILGGPQISYQGAGVELVYPHADVFVRGQGESALVALAQTGNHVAIAGVHYAGKPDAGQQARPALDRLPSPLLDGLIDLKGQDFIRWETRRGCQFKCSFCQHREADGRVERASLPESRIMDEIDLICRSGVKDIAVLDPVFNTNEAPGHAVRVLRRFARSGYAGRLSLQCRAELIDEAFLDAAQALDVCLEFGLQTIHLREQNAIDRTNSMGAVDRVLAQVRERGIDHEVSLIFGLPEQTLESFIQSVRWCLDRQVPVIKAFPLLLLRGTKLELERERWKLVVDDETMPEVVQSDSFTRQDRETMESISQVLCETEGRHPAIGELLARAASARSDRTRWQPTLQQGAH